MRTIGTGEVLFERLIKQDCFYVDKTDFIRQWWNEKKPVTLITRPRRFGKTLTLSMVDTFFSPRHEDDRKLFEHLSICQDSEMMALQGKIPVISLTFSSIKADSFTAFLRELAVAIANLYYEHCYLLEENALIKTDRKMFDQLVDLCTEVPSRMRKPEKYEMYVSNLKHSIQWLSRWLQKYYGEKVLILLDEYDTPLIESYMKGYYGEAIPVMRTLFETTFKSNPYVQRALITGITRVAQEDLFSGFNNVKIYSVLSDGYEDALGFTTEEMDGILREYHLEDRKEELAWWYDGFTFGSMTGIYNPWAVSSYLEPNNRHPELYWANTGGIALLEYLVRYGDGQILVDFQKLLQGQEIAFEPQESLVFADLDNNDRAVWSLLMAAGYLKPVYHPDGTVGYNLTNHEVQVYLSDKVKYWFVLGSVQYDLEFAKAFLADDLAKMNTVMQEIVNISVSCFDTAKKNNDQIKRSSRPENFFHGLTTGLVLCLRNIYLITSNAESGQGRYDALLEPLNRALYPDAAIFEYKVFGKEDTTLRDTANRALGQIDEKGYDTELKARGFDDAHIRKYGFGFRGKEVLIVKA